MKVCAADVGGTSIRAARVADDGTIEERRVVPTPPDPAAGVDLLRRCLHELAPGAPAAVVVAGGIRPAGGEITQSPNLPGWEGLRLRDALSCEVENDANGALLGEVWRGALADVDSALLLTLGTGVGGAILLDGKLWRGATGCAGELGHVPVHGDGPLCRCGARGCLEIYASAAAVAYAAGTADAAEAAARARDGDAAASAAFVAAGEALGCAVAGLVNAFNPEAVCLGGGMAGAFDLLEPAMRREIDRRAFRLAREGLEILPARLGGDAGLLGAARAALLAAGGSL